MSFDAMAIRLSKIVMVAGVAFWAFLITLGNIVDYDANWQFVQHVLAMDSIFPDATITGRAITDPTVQTLAYLLIILVEGLTSLAFLIATVAMARNLKAPKAAFRRAKGWVAVGLIFGVGLWMIGFMAIGAEYFAMWQSSKWNGQLSAFMIYLSLLAIGIYVFLDTDGEPEPER